MTAEEVLRRLEEWIGGHKSRTVSIFQEDGYGASVGWDVTLSSSTGEINRCGMSPEFRDKGVHYLPLVEVLRLALEVAEKEKI